MADEQQRQFQGFNLKAFRFLKDIKAHNNKAWFEAHRGDYEQYLLQPLRDLVTDLGDFMLGIDGPGRLHAGYRSVLRDRAGREQDDFADLS